MKKLIFGILVILMLFSIAIFLYFQFGTCGISPWSCGDYSTNKEFTSQRIQVGDGPEDMAIDTSTGSTRIIVSCSERRNLNHNAGFYQIDPSDNSSSQLVIVPNNLDIFPHGIDIETINGIHYLYAISHHGSGLDREHKIFRFIINQDSLIQDRSYILEDPILTGPNDIDVLADGSFYVSNPTPNNQPYEATKAILGVKNGTVLHYDGNGNWKAVIKEMCYPNGVWVDQKSNYLVVANGGCNTVERFPIEKGKVVFHEKNSTSSHNIDIPVGDNLMLDNFGVLWTAAHPCPLKFSAHQENSDDKSPVQIFAIDPLTMKASLAFQDNGDLISAASTAIRLDNSLYISQVFDPFVLVVEDLEF